MKREFEKELENWSSIEQLYREKESKLTTEIQGVTEALCDAGDIILGRGELGKHRYKIAVIKIVEQRNLARMKVEALWKIKEAYRFHVDASNKELDELQMSRMDTLIKARDLDSKFPTEYDVENGKHIPGFFERNKR